MNRFNLLILLLFPLSLPAQWQRAYITEDGTVGVTAAQAPKDQVRPRNDNFPQMKGFPIAVEAHPTFKNFRNVTLADINGDGREEILWATYHDLFVLDEEGVLWGKTLEGIAIYPPTVGDIDGDGDLEIIQSTAGAPPAGRVYGLDHEGNDLKGWPKNFNDNWIAAAPALVDVDQNDTLEILVNELTGTNGRIHLLRFDGESYSPDWPVELDARPAVTPSAGDLDDDGEIEVVIYSTQTRYVLGLDGKPEDGWPITTHPFQRYSFQSPVIADLDNDRTLEIIGATHGDNLAPEPYFFVDNFDGAFRDGWPLPVPEQSWTFNTPTVIRTSNGPIIFMSRPISTDPEDMLYGFDADGNLLPGFPIVKSGGLEGFISVADVDQDNAMELVFGANIIDEAGQGFIHAYEMDGSGEIAGFPIRTRGFTFMNGANIGDINGDGLMDLVALSYTQSFDQAGTDSVYLNVFELGVTYSPDRVAWGTYKGHNSRNGLTDLPLISSLRLPAALEVEMTFSPNPAGEQAMLSLLWQKATTFSVEIVNGQGQTLRHLFEGTHPAGVQQLEVPLNNLPPGMYWILTRDVSGKTASAPFIKN